MKKILSVFVLAGLLLTSCSGTSGVMGDILKNLEETNKTMQDLAKELEAKKVDLGKIEKISETAGDLADERKQLFKDYQDAYYKDEKGLYSESPFDRLVKEDKQYGEYQAVMDKIEASSVAAGNAMGSAIYTDLDNAASLKKILENGSSSMGTVQNVYKEYFMHPLDDKIDFTNTIRKDNGVESVTQELNDLADSYDWIVPLLKDLDKYYNHQPVNSESKQMIWKLKDNQLYDFLTPFKVILDHPEITEAVLANH